MSEYLTFKSFVFAADYWPYGEKMAEYNAGGNTGQRYIFAEKERDEESGYDYFGARYHDSDIGRWLSVDPLMDKASGFTPYHFSWGNPLIHRDYDGRWPWGIIVGAATGAAISVAFQSVEILTDENKSFEKDFSFTEVGISAVSGAVAGLTGGLTMGINNQTAKIGAELLIDATLSTGVQYATTGEVDLKKSIASAAGGKIMQTGVGIAVQKGKAYNLLIKKADRNKRIAKNNKRSQKKKNAEESEKQAEEYKNRRIVAGGTAASTTIELVDNDEE